MSQNHQDLSHCDRKGYWRNLEYQLLSGELESLFTAFFFLKILLIYLKGRIRRREREILKLLHYFSKDFDDGLWQVQESGASSGQWPSTGSSFAALSGALTENWIGSWPALVWDGSNVQAAAHCAMPRHWPLFTAFALTKWCLIILY